jgi:hypothetical protein
MAQVFDARFGLLLQCGVLAAVVVVAGGAFAWRSFTAMPNALGAPVQQPVPFSHRHHVGDDGIDCRYCHTTVETAAFAGMPSIGTCMSCHSQLYSRAPLLAPLRASWTNGVPLHWRRVYQLPDFVYFNHAIHVAKGVGCVTCHGRVDRMPLTWRATPLTMQWCLDCHRAPENYLRPREHVFDPDWKARDPAHLGRKLLHAYRIDVARLSDCSVCHR